MAKIGSRKYLCSGQTEEELISTVKLGYEFPHSNFINSLDLTDMLSNSFLNADSLTQVYAEIE
jgi:hypothetical protein